MAQGGDRRYFFPRHVWTPSGGWWTPPHPSHNRNFTILLGGLGIVALCLFNASAEAEVRVMGRGGSAVGGLFATAPSSRRRDCVVGVRDDAVLCGFWGFWRYCLTGSAGSWLVFTTKLLVDCYSRGFRGALLSLTVQRRR